MILLPSKIVSRFTFSSYCLFLAIIIFVSFVGARAVHRQVDLSLEIFFFLARNHPQYIEIKKGNQKQQKMGGSSQNPSSNKPKARMP